MCDVFENFTDLKLSFCLTDSYDPAQSSQFSLTSS